MARTVDLRWAETVARGVTSAQVSWKTFVESLKQAKLEAGWPDLEEIPAAWLK